MTPLDQVLKRWVPKRIYDPGSTPAYSNYATALAGYIVSRVSGEPFDNYIERHIFAPLGMRHSTFRQPLPAKFKPFVAEGYQTGKDEPYGYEYIGPAPGRQPRRERRRHGPLHDRPSRRTAVRCCSRRPPQLMHSTANTPIPGLQSHSLGFYQSNINGHRVVSHGGDTVAFHSDLHLFKDDGVGIYVSFNSLGKEGAAGDLRSALLEQFADRYFPAPGRQPQAGRQGRSRKCRKAGRHLDDVAPVRLQFPQHHRPDRADQGQRRRGRQSRRRRAATA